MAYATPADLLARFDARTVGDLAYDDDVQRTPTELATSPNLLAAIDDAAGEVGAALFQSGRYTAAQIDGLTGSAASYLKRIVCTIAMRHLFDRRPSLESAARDEVTDQARRMLEKLRRGENIFNLTPEDPSDDANTPAAVIDTPSAVRAQNLIVDACRGRFYPERRYQN